jgi:hypothetical protein
MGNAEIWIESVQCEIIRGVSPSRIGNDQLVPEVIQYRSGRALTAITKVTARLSIAPAAAGQSPDIAGVSQPSASGQTVERICR